MRVGLSHHGSMRKACSWNETCVPLFCASATMLCRCLTDCKNHPSDLACVDDEDQCDSQPCENGATCYDAKNAFVCDCPEGFNGEKPGVVPAAFACRFGISC